jgi:hypothetical protein
MGNRISITFKYGESESIEMFSHWDGIRFYNVAIEYADHLICKICRLEKKGTIIKGQLPLYRLDPETVMLDFIRWFSKREKLCEINHGYSIGRGDNSDNGKHVIDLQELERQIREERGEM